MARSGEGEETDAGFGDAKLRLELAHRRLGEPQLRCRHLERPSAVTAAARADARPARVCSTSSRSNSAKVA